MNDSIRSHSELDGVAHPGSAATCRPPLPRGGQETVRPGDPGRFGTQDRAVRVPEIDQAGRSRRVLVVIEEGGENVNPIDDEERETVEMCSDVPNARLGCQLTINGDITIRQVN